jgi:2-polyprenyl-3-methyl-5-hydroxy-6-metoxy-1,4-benzoquinol methylase
MGQNNIEGIWSNYFQNHFGIHFTNKEIVRAKNFMHGQLKTISLHCEMKADDRVLEIGCGIGAFVSLLKEKNIHDITAIELDEYAAEFVRRTQKIEVFNSSIENFSDERKYSKIYAFEVLEHLTDPIRDIEKISNMLEPNGYFIGSTPYPFKKNIISDASHFFVLHPDNWTRLFNLAGLSVVHMQPASAIPYLYRFSPFFSRFIPIYIPGFKIVSTTLFVAQKKPS